jgi:hypothetical protein
MNKYLTNWKTTSTGLISIAGAITLIAFAIKQGDLNEEKVMAAVTALTAGVGLIFARDYDKSSEQTGLKQ